MPCGAFWRPDQSTPLGAARDWLLQMGCTHCAKVTTHRLTELADQFGARVSIGDIIRRMRGKGCRGQPIPPELVSEEKQGRSGRFKRIPIPLD